MTTETRYVDLHVHTNYSDGVFTPQEAVRYAKKAGLAAISITDHDTVGGIPSAIAEGEAVGVEIIPGVELSTELQMSERSEMHILGYYIDWKDPRLLEPLAKFRDYRKERAQKILKKLSQLGIHLDEKHLYSIAGTESIGRLHFAKEMIEEGIVGSITDAFHRYLGIGRAAYVPKMSLSPEAAIRMISDAGGVSVLAHPYYGHYSNKALLHQLVGAGLCGIEAWHSKHPPSAVEMFSNMARELGLITTGGSDCHGSYGNEPALMGTVKVPYSVIDGLKKCRRG